MTSAAERQRAELTSQIAVLVAGMLPGAGEEAARQAAGQAARNVPGCAALLDHLRAHPDALRSGRPEGPLSLVRLAHALATAGAPGVVLPGCAGCGKVTADLRSWPGSGLACQSCYQDARREPCARCGATARVNARGPDGPVCGRCYQQDPVWHETCARCGQMRRTAYRDAEGRPLCALCYPRPQRQCSACGQTARITANTGTGPVCERCYRPPPRPCGRCGRVRSISVRANDGEPDLCASCHRGPVDQCSRCGQHRPRRGYQDGKPICDSCYKPPPDRCGFCGQLAPITARWEAGAVCASCYPKARASPVACPSCGQPRVLTRIGAAGQPVCGPCAGEPGKYLCRRCAGPADGFARGMCSRCALDERVTELLGEHDAAGLAPIGQALRGAANPKSVLTWIYRSNSARLLTDLARASEPLTHELIDSYPRSHARSQVRQALVHAGVLPPRDELIEDVEDWLDDQLRDAPRHHAQLIRPFGHWVVLRRARQRAQARAFTEGSAAWARQQVRVALDFLAWLDQRGVSLAGVSQPDIDAWLAGAPAQRYTIRYFLRWARARQLAGPLTVPRRQARNPDQALPEGQRWNQLQRCLRDDSLPLNVRVAGSLLLLYGQPVSRIAQMTTAQLTRDQDENAYLTFSQHPVLVPPALARLITELTATATPVAVLGGRGNPTPWLFPGQVPGRHLADNGLRGQLLDHGIQARPSRGAALISLAADLPAPVLADLLGLHVNTTVRWVRRASRDWASYIAARRSGTTGDDPAGRQPGQEHDIPAPAASKWRGAVAEEQDGGHPGESDHGAEDRGGSTGKQDDQRIC